MQIEKYISIVAPRRDYFLDLAYKITMDRQEAEDIVQEVMLKIWDIRDRLENDKDMNIEGYCTSMVRNLSLDYLRKKQIRKHNNYNNELDECLLPDEILILKDARKVIEEIINTLPPLQQKIIRMKEIEAYETEEIAKIIQTNVESVRNNLSRARKKVRDMYIIYNKTKSAKNDK